MASIKEVVTANGARFDVRWRLPNGRDRQKRFASRRQAQAWLRAVTASPIDTLAGRTTFDDVAVAALAAKTLKPSTLTGYERIVRDRLLPTFGGMKIDKVDRAAVVAWIAGLPSASASTKRQWVTTLNKIIRYAVREGFVGTNVVDGLVPPMAPQRPDQHARYLTATEVDKLATTLAGMDAWPLDVLVKFAAWTGLRAGELTALTVGDLCAVASSR